MFDFRYHALSLAAVFLALAVGLLLGVAIGDKELVSSAKNDIRHSLEHDLSTANSRADNLNDQLQQEKGYSEDTYPILTGDLLPGKHIGIVVMGGNESSVESEIDDALKPTGAQIDVVAVVRDQVDRGDVASAASGTRYAHLDDDASLMKEFGRRMGIQIVLGGRLIGQVRRPLLRSLSGAFGNLDGVVVMRRPVDATGDAAKQASALQDGIARGLVQTGVPVVGVEPANTHPSQVSWYRDRELSALDDVDLVAGHTALVYLLAGADGAYGTRQPALLPPIAQAGGRPSAALSSKGARSAVRPRAADRAGARTGAQRKPSR